MARSNSIVSSTAKLVQFPLIPAFAVTCHRFQGQTILNPSKVVIDLRKVFQAAQSYVMLSRVQSLEQLHILEKFPEEKLYIDQKALMEIRRLEEISINRNPSPWDKDDQTLTKVVYLNVRSIKNKFDMITSDYSLLNADIILLNETWIDREDINITLDGYKVSLNGGGRGRGTVAFFKRKFTVSNEFNENRVTITKLSSEDLDIINIYRSSDGNIEMVVEILQTLINIQKVTLIGGDINICFIKNRKNPLSSYLMSLGFSQLVKQATHIDGGLIDHVYFLQVEEQFEVHLELVAKYYSDHDATCVCLRKCIHRSVL